MKKRTAGIYARYNTSEQTFCAEYLAAYIVNCYRFAKWFVPVAPNRQSRYYGFSHQWDSTVIQWDAASAEMQPILNECDTFFFFEPNDEIFERLKKTTTACVFDPRNQRQDYWRFAAKCDWLLLPNQYWLDEYSIVQKFPGSQVAVWPYDPYNQCIPKAKTDFELNPRVFFPAFGFPSNDRQFVEEIAAILKIAVPNVQTVIGFYDATSQSRPGYDAGVDDWRLLKYLQNSDWLVDLTTKPTYNLFAAFAGGYGLQWSGFDIPPNADYYNSARRHLIQVDCENMTAHRLTPDLESTAEQLVRQFNRRFHDVFDREAGSGTWEQRRAEFLRVTNAVLGIKSRY